MRWIGRRESSNVEDQRGGSGSSSGRGGLPGGLFSKGGIGMIVIVLLISWVTGSNPLTLLQQVSSGSSENYTEQSQPYQATAAEAELASFVKVVLADTEDVWNSMMQNYRNPTLVLFSGSVQSGCGEASSSTGPFYCSADEKVYIDLSFYNELKSKLEAPGDFAQAYVIAHEVGHHVQHILGISDKMQSQRGQVSDEEYNRLSVRLELQADFLAGVWAHHANNDKKIIEPGDIEEALTAASAIGDDRLQKKFQGQVVPDSFTHGTSEQRVRWFRKGYETGDTNQGDTFSATSL